MSFDARSLDRLRQLGRTLPQRLPAPLSPSPLSPAPEPPASAAAPAPASPGTGNRRHRLETETDPEALFHALVQASADGSAPPHLLERLRELEAQRLRPAAGAAPSSSPGAGGQARPRPGSGRGRGPGQPQGGRPDPKLPGEHGDLYTTFQQLLLEDDEI